MSVIWSMSRDRDKDIPSLMHTSPSSLIDMSTSAPKPHDDKSISQNNCDDGVHAPYRLSFMKWNMREIDGSRGAEDVRLGRLDEEMRGYPRIDFGSGMRWERKTVACGGTYRKRVMRRTAREKADEMWVEGYDLDILFGSGGE